MSKRHVTFVQSAFRHILSDVSNDIPELHAEMERDYSRLCSALETRGLRFATIDLVDFGKHFDKCLSESRLTRLEGPHTRPYKASSVIPRLFRGLLKRVFHDSGELTSDPDVASIRYLRQLYKVAKKLRLECTDDRTYEAVRSFFQVEESLPRSTLRWDLDDYNEQSGSRLVFGCSGDTQNGRQLSLKLGIAEEVFLPRELARCLHFTADAVASLIGVFDPYQWQGKHGPGAVADLNRGSKYEFPTWPAKLEAVFPCADFAYANYALWADDLGHDCVAKRFELKEPPSKLIAVPKTQKGPRLIASEPTSHQWCQQFVKAFLTERVKKTFLGRIIHFRDQSYNNALARRASITGSHWTIDLSEASDRLSCYVVERLFRNNSSLLKAFHAVRTRSIINRIDKKSPALHMLRKFSTMGSALTFPVQSISFAMIVLACLLYKRRMVLSLANLEELSREVLVFGDDLIVPDDVGYDVLGTLRALHLKVNLNKTYGKGRFRESCGGEYFDGHDVTPNYLLALPDRLRPESLSSTVAVRNNFFRSGYWRCAAFLERTVREVGRLVLPYVTVGSGTFGLESYGVLDNSHLKSKWDDSLHRRVIKVHGINTRVPCAPDRLSSRVLQYFTERPLPTSKWEGGVRERPHLSLRMRWEPVPV
jgi:hypothetical protein